MAATRRSAPPPAKSDSDQTIDAQLVEEVWLRTRSSVPASLAVLGAAWLVIRDALHTSTLALVVYFAMMTMSVARLAIGLSITRGRLRLAPHASYALMLGILSFIGISIGYLDLFLYRALDPVALGVWIILIAGLAGGATASLGPRPVAFCVFTLPPLVALIAATILWPRPRMFVFGFSTGVWILYGLAQVAQYHRSRREFLKLNHDLRANNRELAQKNVELVEMSRRADRIFSALGEALPGKVLAGKYRLETRIGAGGFAIVFRGTHVDIGRALAIKLFRPQPGNDSMAALERFRQEGLAVGRTRHPNIVEVVDAGVSDDGIPYIAMELLSGHTLETELVLGKPLEMDRIAPIMEAVCHGLAAAHAANVVHRDVKPENIFLHGEPGREVVKILDFGIAKVTDAGRLHNANLTSTGDIIGSPYYMAPERLLGRDSDASADSYSVGLILYRALTGKLPFEGTVSEIVLQAVTKRPPDIAEIAPTLPGEVARVIMRALADDPAHRPAVAEIAETLSHAARRAA